MPLLGLAEFQAALKRVAAGADQGSRQIVVKCAAEVERRAKQNFSGSHSRGQPHVGGDKPNVVSGTLRRSIHHTPITRDGLASYSTTVGPATVYGRRVELGYGGGAGFRGGGRMHYAIGQQPTRAFPYFMPAVRDAQGQFSAIAAEQWRTFIKA